jgi:rhamnosyltransferase
MNYANAWDLVVNKGPANCAAVIVTYSPDNDTLSYLEILPKHCRDVYVVDNTPLPHIVSFPDDENLHVERLNQNQGLSKAFNKGIELAASRGHRNIFVFDQDTRIPPSYFENMLQFKNSMDGRYSNCALCVPNFLDRNSGTFAKYPIISRYSVRHRTCNNLESESPEDALIAITSGTLIDYEMYRQIGPFREDYFIDFSDNEYCLRVHRRGFRVAVNYKVTIDHAIGQRENHRFLSLSIKPNHHHPVRRYYIARNGVRTALEYFNRYPSYTGLIFTRFAHEILSILLYEKEATKKISFFLNGVIDGIAGRMGAFGNR